jgi:hypothetical protein
MAEDRKPLPRCPIERRIAHLKAAKARHAQQVVLARLEREVAALGDPRPPSASEMASRASGTQMEAILRDIAGLEAACDRS